MNGIDEIVALLQSSGRERYMGEPVSQLEHALQTARLAEEAGAADALVIAGLLHDVGHLLHRRLESAAARGLDGRHELAGATWLARLMPASVTGPIRLHVAAKRYLSALEPDYGRDLSPASQRSLELQGGPFTAAEKAAFESDPHYREAVALRRWDDCAKTVGLTVPGVDHYLARLRALIGADGNGAV